MIHIYSLIDYTKSFLQYPSTFSSYKIVKSVSTLHLKFFSIEMSTSYIFNRVMCRNADYSFFDIETQWNIIFFFINNIKRSQSRCDTSC